MRSQQAWRPKKQKKSERPVDALAVNPKNINDSLTDPLTAWNQEMLAHLKTYEIAKTEILNQK